MGTIMFLGSAAIAVRGHNTTDFPFYILPLCLWFWLWLFGVFNNVPGLV